METPSKTPNTGATAPSGSAGVCHPAFARLREAFEDDLVSGRSVGASLCLVVGGEVVVDLWGGHADEARSRDWARDTIVNVWSCTKAWAAVCVLILVDRGLVDLAAPVARYWPEFAQHGKGAVTVAEALSHRAAVVTYRRYLGRADETTWAQLAAELAAERPFWEPGAGAGAGEARYHAFTFGVLAGEVVRRVTGKTMGAFFAEAVARAHALDMHVGFGPALDARVADCIEGPGLPSEADLDKIGGDDVARITITH